MRFKERAETVGLKVLRVVNARDGVPKSPGLFLNEGLPPAVLKAVEWLPWCFSHVGVELALANEKSPFLKRGRDEGTRHNLKAYLHLLDGLVTSRFISILFGWLVTFHLCTTKIEVFLLES